MKEYLEYTLFLRRLIAVGRLVNSEMPPLPRLFRSAKERQRETLYSLSIVYIKMANTSS
ncbi:MAG: hypothetical protein AB1606_00900 [Nitrospirota bacterium]